jgi:hypothetical protein
MVLYNWGTIHASGQAGDGYDRYSLPGELIEIF